MAFKEFVLDEQTKIKIYKRRGSSSIRLSILASGEIRVTMPTWAPYRAGLQFVQSKLDWIKAQQRPRQLLMPGQAIGKAHHLQFVANQGSGNVTSRVLQTAVYVRHPQRLSWQDTQVQQKAEEASVRALRSQAESLLPQRLATLAERHSFRYNHVRIKRLKSRWGSCDSQQNIVLNLFLMQLPWQCIDYVLLHELAHTKHMNHGAEFWSVMEDMIPNIKALRKTIRGYQPLLNSVPHQPMA